MYSKMFELPWYMEAFKVVASEDYHILREGDPMLRDSVVSIELDEKSGLFSVVDSYLDDAVITGIASREFAAAFAQLYFCNLADRFAILADAVNEDGTSLLDAIDVEMEHFSASECVTKFDGYALQRAIKVRKHVYASNVVRQALKHVYKASLNVTASDVMPVMNLDFLTIRG